MLAGSGVFNEASRPGLFKVRIRILPPPDGVAAGILTEDNIEVTIFIDITGITACLGIQAGIINDEFVPAFTVVFVSYDRWDSGTFANDKVIDTVLVNVEDQTACLLLAVAGSG
jgi:hypothetical protein